MAEKRYYWIKLKTDFFDREEVKWVMSKKDGTDYMIIFLALCTKAVNSDGVLYTKVGEMVIPYDSDIIYRELNGRFKESTILAALMCLKQAGLIVESNSNGYMQISNYSDMVGSESSSAQRMRKLRDKSASQCDKEVTQSDVTLLENSVTSASQSDIRDIDIKKKEYIYSLSFVNIQERNEKNEEPVFLFPSLRGDVAIYQDWIDAEQDAYPNVDVLAEIKKARLWCLQDNKRLKIKIGSFLNRWFAREQDKNPNRNLPAKSNPARVYKNPDSARYEKVGEEVDL